LLFVAGADGAAHTQALQSRPDVLVQDLEDFTPQQSKQAAREMSADLWIEPPAYLNARAGIGTGAPPRRHQPGANRIVHVGTNVRFGLEATF
jgi:hypothetical protein